MENKKSSLILPCIIFLVLFGGLFAAGTFFDETIAGTLFAFDNTVIRILTSVGVYPFFASFVLFGGALFGRAFRSGYSLPVKIILCVICAALAAGVGFFGGKILADKSGFGYAFPQIIGSLPVIIGICVVSELPLFFVGFRFSRKSEDKLLVQRIIGLLAVLALAYLTMTLLKNAFPRPRYRTVVLGYEGVGFTPWYSPLANPGEFAELYGISADEFRSFPSGHSILSVSSVYIFPSLAWLFPKLNGKQTLLTVIGALFGCFIMLTRMMTGAHYLTDVSAGAIIATLLSFVYAIIQLIISSRDRNRANAA
ncbi:MAG: phosphatase PAP2 family protein [Ruminiclostridium sp.]|nr:phosphatase PAP2 family protein [Ruminiclostridium sp.]